VTNSDWYIKPVWRLCVAVENPAVIFLWAPSSWDPGGFVRSTEKSLKGEIDIHGRYTMASWQAL